MALKAGIKNVEIIQKISLIGLIIFIILILIGIKDLRNCNCKTKVGSGFVLNIYMILSFISGGIYALTTHRLNQLKPITNIL